MINKLEAEKDTITKPFISDLDGINKSVNINEINEKETRLLEFIEKQRVLIELLNSRYLEREVYWDENLKLTYNPFDGLKKLVYYQDIDKEVYILVPSLDNFKIDFTIDHKK